MPFMLKKMKLFLHFNALLHYYFLIFYYYKPALLTLVFSTLVTWGLLVVRLLHERPHVVNDGIFEPS